MLVRQKSNVRFARKAIIFYSIEKIFVRDVGDLYVRIVGNMRELYNGYLIQYKIIRSLSKPAKEDKVCTICKNESD